MDFSVMLIGIFMMSCDVTMYLRAEFYLGQSSEVFWFFSLHGCLATSIPIPSRLSF